MDKKVEQISELLGLPKTEVCLVLYSYLSYILEDLVVNKHAMTMFGELIMDDNNNITFKHNKFEFDNELFSKKDMRSLLQVVENGPGSKIF
jgi:hypothetical protein